MSAGSAFVRGLIAAQVRAQRTPLLLAALSAAGVSVAAAALLGVSGWFLTGAALAGLAGPAMAISFNFLLPSAVIRLLAIVRTALRYGERLSGHHAALDALAAIRPPLFARMAQARPGRVLALASGEVTARLGQDVDALQTAFVRRSSTWGAVGAATAGLALAALAGWIPAAITVLAIAASLTSTHLLGWRLAERAGRDSQTALGALKAEVSALEQAAPELVAYGAATIALNQVGERAAALDIARQRLAAAGGWMLFAQLAVMGLATAALLVVSVGGEAPLAALAVLGTIAAIEGAGAFAEAARQRGAAEAAIQRIGELVEGGPVAGASPDSAAELTLAGLQRPLHPGDRVAITGPSGSGKTSLIERLMALREPRAAEWRVGSVDVSDLDPTQLRGLFSYAPQDARFVAGSLGQNLRLGAPAASDADLWAALDDVGLAHRFRGVGGLEAPLRDDAAGLSGGERRRLALARAYLKPSAWLVLDEPTEGLDPATEAKVLTNLDRRLAEVGQGLILISHRQAALVLTGVAIVVAD